MTDMAVDVETPCHPLTSDLGDNEYLLRDWISLYCTKMSVFIE